MTDSIAANRHTSNILGPASVATWTPMQPGTSYRHLSPTAEGIRRDFDEREREAIASIQESDRIDRELDRELADITKLTNDQFLSNLRLLQSSSAARASATKLLNVLRSARWQLIGKPLCARGARNAHTTARRCRVDAPVRRDNRRAPRRTGSARPSSSAGDGEPPPEPEPPGNRRCPSLGAAPVEISTEHAPDPAHRGALVDLLADLIGGGR